MKKISSILCALVLVASAFAAPQKGFERVAVEKTSIELKSIPFAKSAKAAKQVLRAAKAPKAASDFPIITEQPDGELKTYARTGGYYYVQSQQLYIGQQSGSIDVVFASDNKVYFKELLYKAASNYWIEGTLSADGKTITVPLGQNIAYSSQYDAAIALALIKYDETNGFSVDKETKQVTFSVNNDTIALNGTAQASVSLGGVWTDDGTIQFYGDYASVYEPGYVAPELVVLPDGATVVEYTMDYINPKDDSQGAKSINVAVVENQVYFQGMSQYLPDSWVVGTKDGNNVTFAANQFMGTYGTYGDSYFFANGGATFVYDAANDKYSATGEMYGLLADSYYDGRYKNPVLNKAKEADTENPILVTITDAEWQYDSQYKDVIYTMTNATADTTFVFDIYVDGTDVELDSVYTYAESMETSATYTYVQIGENKTGFKSATFVKTMGTDNLAVVEALVIDATNNVYKIYFKEKPFTPTGEEVNLFMTTPTDIPSFYEDGSIEFYVEQNDTTIAFVYFSETLAGTFTNEDLDVKYSGMYLGDTKVDFHSGTFTVSETDEQIKLSADMYGKNGVLYHITMFFNKPTVENKVTITANNLEMDDAYSWLGMILVDASNDNYTISLTLTVDPEATSFEGTYTAGVNLNGTLTPTDGEKVEFYSGSLNLTVNAETSYITMKGSLLAMNNTLYDITLTNAPNADFQAIDNVSANIKAVKRIQNGMLIIESGNMRFNILGQELK